MRAIDLREAIERVIRNLADKAGNHRIVTDLPSWSTSSMGGCRSRRANTDKPH